MSGFFGLLASILLIAFIVGIVSPKTIFWAKKKTRKTALIYLVAFIVFSIIFAELSPEADKISTSDTSLISALQAQKNTSDTDTSSVAVNKSSSDADTKLKDPTPAPTPSVPSTPSMATVQNEPTTTLNLIISKPNTSEAVDYVAMKAKEDAKTVTDEQIKTARDYIVSNLTNLTKDNDTMEHVMYYGKLLEYACKENNEILSNIGTDAQQAVKYQYRGYNTDAEKTATAENVRQILKGFSKLNNEK